MGSDWTAGGWRGSGVVNSTRGCQPASRASCFPQEILALWGSATKKLARVPTAGNYLGVWAGWDLFRKTPSRDGVPVTACAPWPWLGAMKSLDQLHTVDRSIVRERCRRSFFGKLLIFHNKRQSPTPAAIVPGEITPAVTLSCSINKGTVGGPLDPTLDSSGLSFALAKRQGLGNLNWRHGAQSRPRARDSSLMIMDLSMFLG
jgi:hypothetical protein